MSIVLHVNHPNEVVGSFVDALAELHRGGVTLLNQSVLLAGVNDDVESLEELSQRLFDHHVLPYYLHLPDRVRGTHHFDVSQEKGLALIAALRARLPGYLVPRLAREVPGLDAKQIVASTSALTTSPRKGRDRGPKSHDCIFYTAGSQHGLSAPMSDYSLRLIVPESTFVGLSMCDTHPAALAEWVLRLPMAHTFEAAHQLLKSATELARITAEPELRFNCLETIRPLDALHLRASRSHRGRRIGARRRSCAARAIGAAGAGARLQGSDSRRAGPPNGSSASSTDHDEGFARRTRCIEPRPIFRVRCCEPTSSIPMSPPKGVVRTESALSSRRRTRLLAERVPDEQSRGGGMLTIADVYLRIALLAVAKPNQLRQKDLSRSSTHSINGRRESRIGAPADDTLFVVDLDADSPPSLSRTRQSHRRRSARHPHRRAGLRTRSLPRGNGVRCPGARLHQPRPAAASGARMGRDEEALVPALALDRTDEDLHRPAHPALLHLRRRRIRRAARNDRSAAAP